jgi:hypothetical protein
VIVLLAADGVVVQDADDLDDVRLRTELDPDRTRVALLGTGTGELVDGDVHGDTAALDLGVLRARAVLQATSPDWARRWAEMVERAERDGRLSRDGRSVRVPVER